MLKEIFHYIYCMSIPSTVFVLVLVCCLWNTLSSKCKSLQQYKTWRVFNCLLFLLWFVCIIYMTIFSRGSKTEINLIPFRFIFEPFRTGNEEFFRVGWMNILLFIPGGMWLSYGMKKPTKIKYVLQIIFLMLVSITIETLQWYYKLGTVETDDVICNSLGAMVGVTSIIWAEKLVTFINPYIIKIIKYIKGKINKT